MMQKPLLFTLLGQAYNSFYYNKSFNKRRLHLVNLLLCFFSNDVESEESILFFF